jgi:oxygen-dependent protoporphyrinogen oxidase
MTRYGWADVYHPENGPGIDDTTMEEFFYRKINGEMFEYWVEPTMDVFCGYQPHDLSSKMLLLLFGSYLSQKLFTFEEGIGFLPDTLADHLNVSLNAQVLKIELLQDKSGAKIHYRQDGETKKLDLDAVVMAVPGDAVLDLIEDPLPAWKEFFSRVQYTNVGIVYHLLQGDAPLFDEGGIMFPRKEDWKLSALGWKRRPDGRVLAMSDLKAHLYDPSVSDDELIAAITPQVIKAVPEFKDAIQDQMVFRWQRKVPTYPVGQLSAIKTFWENAGEGPLYFCGDYLIGPSAGSALASGWQCVDRLLGDLD